MYSPLKFGMALRFTLSFFALDQSLGCFFRRLNLLRACVLAFPLILAACGGGGGGGSTTTPPPPPPPAVQDADSDGVVDAQDACPATPSGQAVDANGCAASQLDSDSDGVSDASDSCPATPAAALVDTVGCADSQLNAALCHSDSVGPNPVSGPLSVSGPIVTKLEAQGQYFDRGRREFGATATSPDHAQDAITIYDGMVYAAYYGEGGRLKLARKPVSACVWKVITFPYTQTDPDSHRSANVAISPNDKRIHIIWGLHADNNPSISYIVSNIDNATDVSDDDFNTSLFGERRNELRAGDALGRITYPRFIVGSDDNLLVFWRRGGSGNGDSYLAEYVDGSWSTQRLVVRGGVGDFEGSTSRNAYFNTITYLNNQLHLTWTWRESSNGIAANHDLMHAYSEDNGRTWMNQFGVVIGTSGAGAIKMNLDSEDITFAEVRTGDVFNQCGQTATSDGRIHVIQRYGNAYQYHRWGPDLNENDWTAALDFGANGGRPKIYSGPDDSLWVVGINAGRIQIHAAAKQGDSWDTWEMVYRGAVSQTTDRYITSGGYVDGNTLVILAQREAADADTAETTEIEVLTFELQVN